MSTTESFIGIPTFGAEIEKVFSNHCGDAHAVSNDYFRTIGALGLSRDNVEPIYEYVAESDTIIGVSNSIGKESLDNSFVLGESSVWPPVTKEAGGLSKLHHVLKQQLSDVVKALESENATVINMSNHPLTEITKENYEKYVAPKPVYKYLREQRGWDHAYGINAKAQNSPSIGISPEYAVDALNCSIGVAAAVIALYGNSPFDQGKVTGQKESRLGIWEKMFERNRFDGDRRTCQMPEKPFANMRDYFTWMFDEDTAMYFLVTDEDGQPLTKEKGQNISFIMIDEHPTLLKFLEHSEWEATEFETGRKLRIEPHMGHFALHQFTHFAGARIRFGIDEEMPVDEFNGAIAGHDDAVDELLSQYGQFFYIEEREPGANFPDREVAEQGDEIAKSVVISPSAIYSGLIRNLSASKALINKYGWNTLRNLREDAITNGLDATYNDIKVRDVCYDVLETAAQGLESNEQWMLAYPEYVLTTGQNGADRALARYDQLSGAATQRIRQIVQERSIVLS